MEIRQQTAGRSRVMFFVSILSVLMFGCKPTTWQDATGSARGDAELQMDSANCQLYSQSSSPQTDTSQCQQGDKGCVIGGVLGNILSQVNTFNLCMQSRGWQKVQVASVAQPLQTPTEVASADDDQADDDDSDSADIMADAKDAFLDGDYAAALDLYREAADDGDAEAENKVGLFYANGWGVDRDPKRAMHWFHKADEDGSGHAEKNLAVMRRRLHVGYYHQAHFLVADEREFHGLPHPPHKSPMKKCSRNRSDC